MSQSERLSLVDRTDDDLSIVAQCRLLKVARSAIYQKSNTSRRQPDHQAYPYLLRGLAIDRPNQVWCADITYIPLAKGFVYLAR